MKLITTSARPAGACSRIAESPVVTVDTEFMRETTYWPKLCVIQMASPEEAVIVDALAAELDLDPFFELMAEREGVKVFHAARQDIEIVYHLGGLIPHPIFDTQVAAMVCGFGEFDQLRPAGPSPDRRAHRQVVALHRLERAARSPSGSSTTPLADVTHLRDVYQALGDAAGRAEPRRLGARGDGDPDLARHLRPRSGGRLEAPQDAGSEADRAGGADRIAAWREQEAQARDVPRGRVLKDEAIFEIAQQQPTTARTLGQLRTIPRGFERSRAARGHPGGGQEGAGDPEGGTPARPAVTSRPNGNGAAVDLLKVLLKMVSESHGVASKIIATVDDLEAIAADDKADVPALAGWRRELFGETALQAEARRSRARASRLPRRCDRPVAVRQRLAAAAYSVTMAGSSPAILASCASRRMHARAAERCQVRRQHEGQRLAPRLDPGRVR